MLEVSVNRIIRLGECYDELLGELFFCSRHYLLGLQVLDSAPSPGQLPFLPAVVSHWDRTAGQPR